MVPKKTTSRKVASKASDLLRSKGTPEKVKSVAASALAQRERSKRRK